MHATKSKTAGACATHEDQNTKGDPPPKLSIPTRATSKLALMRAGVTRAAGWFLRYGIAVVLGAAFGIASHYPVARESPARLTARRDAGQVKEATVEEFADFDIPAQSVDRGTIQLGVQAGITSVIIDFDHNDEATGELTQAVKGRMRAIDAAAKMLSGTHWRFDVPRAGGIWVSHEANTENRGAGR